MALSQAMSLSDSVSVCLCLSLSLVLSLALALALSLALTLSVFGSRARAPSETMAPFKLTSTLVVVPSSFGQYTAMVGTIGAYILP